MPSSDKKQQMQATTEASFQTTGLQRNSFQHDWLNFSLVFVNVVAYVLVIFFNAASSIPQLGIFPRTNANISGDNEVEFTPAGWTFSTWGIIYAWNALWILYNVIILFLENDLGKVYKSPPVLTNIFHAFIFANFCFNITWLFIFAYLEFWGAYVIIVLLTISLYVAPVISHKNIYDAEAVLRNKNQVYLWLYRAFVNNGLAYYATWVTIATFLNFSIALTYRSGVSRQTSSLIGLSIIAALVLLYFVLDIYVFEKYLRYTYSPYLQMIYAFSGILSKNWNPNQASSIFVLVLTIIGPGLMFLTKIIVSIYQSVKETQRVKQLEARKTQF